MAAPTEKEKMLRGELYHAFSPALTAERTRCVHACNRFNNSGEVPRRRLVELWRDINQDSTPLPPRDPSATEEEDDAQFVDDPWVETPFKADYGYNIQLGKNVYINSNCVILDTCLVRIGARTLMGPNVSFYSGTHPLDPVVRNGTRGPELGKEIHVGEDVWIGGNVVFLPGVTIGRGATIGAGSVVTKDVPAFHVAAGNPARIIRKIETTMEDSAPPTSTTSTGAVDAKVASDSAPLGDSADQRQGAEAPMSSLTGSRWSN
ncbi:MAG: pre-mRNA cleavage and polyadenylation factor (CPF) complex subunit [Chaenotheca gracillima]|nr:MAG: pre-mRNA cleavage and polyadenylation factor (CPF) complex subunit [Chaenotheca gracillima]